MRVEIINVASSGVEVRSDLGQFSAKWDGADAPVGAEREVELAFGGRFTWGVDLVPVEPRPHGIEPRPDGGVVLWASVEEVDDTFVGLRLGPSIVMLSANGEPAEVGATVRVEAPAVTLCDTNI